MSCRERISRSDGISPVSILLGPSREAPDGNRVNHLTGDRASAAISDEYADVYVEIHAEPPYNAGPLYERKLFLERTRRQVASPGFELVAADDDGTLAGFAFGLTMEPTGGGAAKLHQPPNMCYRRTNSLSSSLTCASSTSGRGTGKRLLAELLNGRAEPYGVLLANPDASAHAMYQRWGWQVVGTCQPAPDSTASDVLVIDRTK
ncbi:GNAT family N-acetyltransferase [Planotetraspora thailandica]|uniref:GNAT family N-acetyltransferase n=1 Tax=Planotetraspora thailandica TaxID=487172 RepID=UPI00195251E3|nr:GNAT family N-acetyltransferase [Planotetraspora thailandica]